nr:MAG TPA: hypothetical protein [Microviridae sp.]
MRIRRRFRRGMRSRLNKQYLRWRARFSRARRGR